MNPEPAAVVAPADSRVLLGSFGPHSLLFIKEKFFAFHELLGDLKTRWLEAFKDGDYALCRLTPDKYHYVHTPVSGRVVDFYPIAGHYHSCNPGAVVSLADPYSKNMRMVTIIDTDVDGGSGVGLVAVVEVVALMVGEISQRYSHEFYDDPQAMVPGLMLGKGQPKSLFKPGSSTVVCLFQPGRLDFDQDLIDNQTSPNAVSRFSRGFGQPLVETEVRGARTDRQGRGPRLKRGKEIMDNLLFTLGLGALFAVLLWWSRRLPGERWQIAAAIPVGRSDNGRWRGVNLTFYGMFTANAVLLAAALMLVMLGSLGISPFEVMVVMLPLISLSAPAARLVARWVEHKPRHPHRGRGGLRGPATRSLAHPFWPGPAWTARPGPFYRSPRCWPPW